MWEEITVRIGIPSTVTDAAILSVLKKTRKNWRHAQKKRILSKTDLKLQLIFARKVRQKLPNKFWTEGIVFYLDGASFTHKIKPI